MEIIENALETLRVQRRWCLVEAYGGAALAAAIASLFWWLWSSFFGSVPVSEFVVGDLTMPVTRWADVYTVLVAVYLINRAWVHVRRDAAILAPSFLWVSWAAMLGLGILLIPDGNLVFAACLFAASFVIVAFVTELAVGVHCVGGLCIGAGMARGFMVSLVGAVIIVIILMATNTFRRWYRGR